MANGLSRDAQAARATRAEYVDAGREEVILLRPASLVPADRVCRAEDQWLLATWWWSRLLSGRAVAEASTAMTPTIQDVQAMPVTSA